MKRARARTTGDFGLYGFDDGAFWGFGRLRQDRGHYDGVYITQRFGYMGWLI